MPRPLAPLLAPTPGLLILGSPIGTEGARARASLDFPKSSEQNRRMVCSMQGVGGECKEAWGTHVMLRGAYRPTSPQCITLYNLTDGLPHNWDVRCCSRGGSYRCAGAGHTHSCVQSPLPAFSVPSNSCPSRPHEAPRGGYPAATPPGALPFPFPVPPPPSGRGGPNLPASGQGLGIS